MSNQEQEGIQESAKSRTIRYSIFLVLLAVVIIGFYFYLTNQSKNSDKQAEENMTELQMLRQYDLENQYPKTVREVVKLHCRLLKCIYNGELEENDLEALNAQARQLFAEELLSENEEKEQFADLMKEVEDFRNSGKIYVSYIIDIEDDIQYKTAEGIDFAMLNVTCNIREGGTTNGIKEQYLLVKEDGQWKILGWQGIEDTE